MLEVIASGLGKTGTSSLTEALRILGYVVSDFPDMMREEKNFWLSRLWPAGEPPSFGRQYGPASRVSAVVDELPAYHWRELTRAFPDSKVILTVRDSDSWAKSKESHMKTFAERVERAAAKARLEGDAEALRAAESTARIGHEIERRIYGSDTFERASFIAAFEAHNRSVVAELPPERVCVLRLVEDPSWDRLCAFLGRPIPNTPFPKANVGNAMLSQIAD